MFYLQVLAILEDFKVLQIDILPKYLFWQNRYFAKFNFINHNFHTYQSLHFS